MRIRGFGGVIGVFLAIILIAGDSYAAFDRELENLNRKRSMRILDEFNENIESQIGTLELTPEQIRRSLKAQQDLAAEREAFEKKAAESDIEPAEAFKKKFTPEETQAPTIPREQLREMLGLEMDSANEQIPLEIKTDMSMKTVRESNYFERRADALGETEFSYYPGVRATTRQMGWTYKSDYTMGRFLHMNTPHNDRVDHAWSQTLSRTFAKTTWIFSGDLDASSIKSEEASIKPSRYMTSDFKAAVEYAHTPKTTFRLEYSRDTRAYLSDTKNSVDTRNHAFDARYQYALTAKTKLNGGVIFRMNRPPKGDDADDINIYNYYLGISGRFSDKVFYNLRGSLDYAKRSQETSPMNEFVSFAGVVTYRYSPKTRVTLNASRSQVATITETAADPENLLGSFRIDHDLSPKLSFSAAESIRTVTGDSDSLPTTVVDPDFPQDRFTAIRRETHWGTNVSMKYKIDPSSALTLKYAYLDVDSKLKTDGRINHICEVTYDKKF